MEIKLSNSIINKICADTKFEYNGDYFYYNTIYNLKELSINFQIRSKIYDIKDDGTVWAKIFVVGFESNWQKSFKNLNEYIYYLSERSLTLDYKIKNDLDDFLSNLFDDDIYPRY